MDMCHFSSIIQAVAHEEGNESKFLSFTYTISHPNFVLY
jgi:hypothetical protein